ncbi:glycosyltransferase family 39 protein [Anaerolineales bacterium HSG24]|nr:glycosyltransferase family 39 protein [Anaerolineales bacterium HSG24]
MHLITLVAFLFRIASLAKQSLWRDEVDVIRFSSSPLAQLLAELFVPEHNGPLYYLLIRPWRFFVGNSEFALRFPSAAFGTLTVALGVYLSRRLGYSPRVSALIAMLLASSPYLVWYSQEVKMYSLLTALILVAFVAYYQALNRLPQPTLKQRTVLGVTSWERFLVSLRATQNDMTTALHAPSRVFRRYKYWIIFVLFTSLSFYLHILSPLMLPVYVVIAVIHHNQLRKCWRVWLISMAFLILPYLPLLLWQFAVVYQAQDTGHSFYPLSAQTILLVQIYSTGLLKPIVPLPIVLFCFLFLVSLFLSDDGSGWKRRLTLLCWFVGPILGIYLVSLRTPIFEPRYVIYTVLPFYILVARGAEQVRNHSKPIAALCVGLILLFNLISIQQQQHHILKTDFRRAAIHIKQKNNELAIPETIIMMQMPYLTRTLEYYYQPEPVTWLEGVWTNDGKPETAVAAELANTTARINGVWLVVSEEELWDNRGLTRAWFNQHAVLLDEAEYSGVRVYYYRLGDTAQSKPTTSQKPHKSYLPLVISQR